MTRNILSLKNGLPDHCDVYGHAVRATNKHGKYTCDNCKKIGYCPGCLLLVPANAPILHCDQHKEKYAHA